MSYKNIIKLIQVKQLEENYKFVKLYLYNNFTNFIIYLYYTLYIYSYHPLKINDFNNNLIKALNNNLIKGHIILIRKKILNKIFR